MDVPLKEFAEQAVRSERNLRKLEIASIDRRLVLFEQKPLIDRPTFDVIHNTLERRVSAVEGRVWLLFGGVFVANAIIAGLLAFFHK